MTRIIDGNGEFGKPAVTEGRASRPDAPARDPGGGSGRKRYRRPELRVLGAVHLMTRGFGTMYAEIIFGMMNTASDRATKQHIVRIGEHPLGIGLYLFDYKPEFRASAGHGRQLGVMADEVETVLPEAVSVHPDGYKMVDYAMLGFRKPRACKP